MDFRTILDAFNNVAGVIKTVAETPGLNMIPIVNTVAGAASAIQFAYKAGINIAEHIAAVKDTFSGGVPTKDELDALDAKIAELRTKLHAPLPPREEDEPE